MRGLCPYAVAGSLVLAIGITPAHSSAADRFHHQPLSIEGQKLFDLGAVDFDDDGHLDLFTSNHKYPHSLLRNDGSGSFSNVSDAVGLSPSPAFPGLEDITRNPSFDEQGLYVFLGATPGPPDESHTVLQVHNTDDVAVSGDVRLRARVELRASVNADVTVTPDETVHPTGSTVEFAIAPGGRAALKVSPPGIPFQARVDLAYPRGKIHVGSKGVTPPQNEFTLRLADRHGIAWADYDADGSTDAFISLGGFKGQIDRYEGLVNDELQLWDGSRFNNEAGSSGLDKGVCRGRDASAADYDHDGVMNLIELCLGGRPLVYQGHGDGTFTKQPSKSQHKLARANIYRWAQLDGTPGPELVTSRGRQLKVLRYGSAGWHTIDRARLRSEVEPGALSLGDFDRDGDMDIFASSRGSNTLLRNRGAGLEPVPPSRLGLPAGDAEAATWVDFDNDGKLDLYAAPAGLFRAREEGFRRTGLLSGGAGSRQIAVWPDIDNDGARDLVRFKKTKVGGGSVRLYSNRAAHHHWLEIDLTGDAADDVAMGASVTIHAGHRRQTQWVGQNESSRYSQGHYRLYFGLGHRKSVHSVRVEWPDGTSSTLKHVPADQVLEITK